MSEDAFDRVVEREREEHRRRRHRKARRGFRAHATVYVAVNAALAVAWLTSWALSGAATPWFLPILIGWGVALAVHRYAVRRAFGPRRAPRTEQTRPGDAPVG